MKTNWQEGLDKLFNRVEVNRPNFTASYSEIKQFITDLLLSERKKTEEDFMDILPPKVTDLKIEEPEEYNYGLGWNACIRFIIFEAKKIGIIK